MNQQNALNMNALAKYTKVNVQTGVDDASPHRLIQMLMEGALTRISVAKVSIKQGNTINKGENIVKAISIIGGLRDSLDHEVGGQLATNLDNLYEYMTQKLMEANVNNDESALSETHALLTEIKTAWDEIGNSPEANATAQNIEQRKAVG